MELDEWNTWWEQDGATGLRWVLMDEWDPLGVADIPEAPDEYDAYLGQLGRLLRGGTLRDLQEYLTWVRTERIGLPPYPSEDERAAEAIWRWCAAIWSPTGSSESLDLYVLAGGRSHEIVRRFRDRWVTGFAQSAAEYEFPQYAHRPDAVYTSPRELIDRLLADPTQPHSVYWGNPRPGPILHAMLFFTTDGGLIAGLTVATEELAATTLRELAASVDARYGYATCEQPPPDTASEFKEVARATAVLPRLLP